MFGGKVGKENQHVKCRRRCRDIQGAKEEAVKWFLNEGFSQDFICKYPIEFYLNYDVKEKLRNTKTVFNPLPPKCK